MDLIQKKKQAACRKKYYEKKMKDPAYRAAQVQRVMKNRAKRLALDPDARKGESKKYYQKCLKNPDRRYENFKRHAAGRNNPREFHLTQDECFVLFAQPCHYCGIVDPACLSGIDRVNNDEHYVTKNVVPCCTPCNMMKHAQTKEGFLANVARIAAHQKSI